MNTAPPALEPYRDDAVNVITEAADRWDDSQLIAAMIATDPSGLKGVVIDAGPGPARDAWLQQFQTLTEQTQQFLSLPANADEARVVGGLDLVSTLADGKPVVSRGVLEQANGKVLLVRMAERLRQPAVHALADALDQGAIRIERDGFSQIAQTSFLTVLLNEGLEDEIPSAKLIDRLAFRVRLDGIPSVCLTEAMVEFTPVQISRARSQLLRVSISDDILASFAAAALAVGIGSVRVLSFCMRASKALAALYDPETVGAEDVEVVARLVLGPRAQAIPEAEEPEQQAQSEEQEADQPSPDEQQTENGSDDAQDDGDDADSPLDDIIAEAVAAGAVSMQGLTAQLGDQRQRSSSAGRVGASARSQQEGRPIGSEPGDPRAGGRLDVLATLRTAAPWRKLRPPPVAGSVVRVYPSDLRVRKYAHKTATSVIFLVDASGSSALNRLGEAKGAVEALLTECYARRDSVGLITFKGAQADITLPPSRSLTRARKAMAGLPGGGGTPLASALALGVQTALTERAAGRTPLLVLFSDAQANVGLDGMAGRAQAREDAAKMAQHIAAEGISTLFFDTSPRPSPRAVALGEGLRATYIALPYADNNRVNQAVTAERRSLAATGG